MLGFLSWITCVNDIVLFDFQFLALSFFCFKMENKMFMPLQTAFSCFPYWSLSCDVLKLHLVLRFCKLNVTGVLSLIIIGIRFYLSCWWDDWWYADIDHWVQSPLQSLNVCFFVCNVQIWWWSDVDGWWCCSSLGSVDSEQGGKWCCWWTWWVFWVDPDFFQVICGLFSLALPLIGSEPVVESR